MVSKTFNPKAMTIGELLSASSDALEVPAWQRSYSWTSEEWSTFWTDLLEFDRSFPGDSISGREYFLGSAVLVNPEGNANDKQLLLDGQQRLSTATILMSAIRDTRAPLDKRSSERLQEKHIVDYDDTTESLAPVLTLNQYDRHFFRAEIQTPPDELADRPEIKQESHRRIRKARDFFIGVMNTEMENAQKSGGEEAARRRSVRIQSVLLKHCALVAVYSDDEDNAASVFETLNDRGIGLSTTDLLRNYLLRVAGNAESREQIIQHWQSVFENTGQSSADKFLRHYWLSKHGDVKSRRLYREIKNHVGTDKIPSLQFTRDLDAESLTYRGIINCEHPDEDIAQALQDIKDLGAQVTYPLIMAALRAEDENVGTIRSLLDFVTNLFIRYQVICARESSILETHLYNAAVKVRESGNVQDAIDILSPLMPSMSDFISSFSIAEVSRVSIARLLLRKIEDTLRSSDELEVASNQKVHLEHIYPKSPIGDRLPEHNRWVNRIGNLTLLGRRMNTSIRNSSFDIKKEEGYQGSEIELTRQLLDYDGWTVFDIESRQRMLSAQAARAFALEGESIPSYEEVLRTLSMTEKQPEVAPDRV